MRCPDRCKRCLEFGIADDVRASIVVAIVRQAVWMSSSVMAVGESARKLSSTSGTAAIALRT
ncbi:hypothetical protein FHX05_005240 [Rhizobium sp. BK491]|nr:hypothetical protein [Rhizobium sp. BK491]